MIRLASDEDFNNLILRELRRRLTNLDVVRVQDAGLSAMTDETMAHVYARLSAGMTMPGIFVIPQWVPIGAAVDDLVLIMTCSDQSEWRDQVLHLPLK